MPRQGTALGGGGSECELPGYSLQLDAASFVESIAKAVAAKLK